MKEKKLVVFDMDGTLNRIELFIIPTYKGSAAPVCKHRSG